MIDKIEDWGDGEGLFLLTCDGRRCTVEQEIEGYWDDVIAYMRDHDWSYYQEDGQWVHLCPACKAAEDFR